MTPLAAKIRAEIEAAGPMSFAQYMEWALYHPDHGYYQRRRVIGRQGDYYTSVSTGRLFGELLAFAFAEWRAAQGTAPFRLVEGGAHDGRLARDILEWFRTWRADASEVEYWILEPSGLRRAWQRETLGESASQVRWAADWSGLPSGGVRGVIFANELLDALPVRRWAWDATRRDWFERGVGVESGRLRWVRLDRPQPPRAAAVDGEPWGSDRGTGLSPELMPVLPDGFTIEICPAAVNWWRSAAAVLVEGRLLTIDYGLTADEVLASFRGEGTVRAYARHQATDVALDQAGEQDLTAHVNFSALQAAGEDAGLDTETFGFQGDFLTRVVAGIEREPGRFAPWTAARRRQLATLVHPEHLGRAFRVLAQRRKAIS